MNKQYIYILLGFYTIMELLQTIQYQYVNQCDNPINIFLTNIAYILVIVQPLMWNTIYYLRTRNTCDSRVFKLAMALCVVWISMNVLQRCLFNKNDYDKVNKLNDIHSDDKTCTHRDSSTSHLYWKWTTEQIPNFSANWFMYICLWFIPALLVFKTRLSSIYLMISAIIGAGITYKYGSYKEFSSTWCYISLPILLFIFVEYFLTK